MEYRHVFNRRGRAYDTAMQRFPNARANEFRALFDGIELRRDMDVVDVPAGGGYLRPYLPAHVKLHEYECSSGFFVSSQNVSLINDIGALPERSFDLAVSVAALHHVADKGAFILALLRSLRPGGAVLLADVEAGSSEAQFLDGFVAQNNVTGHNGMYLQGGREHLSKYLKAGAARIRTVERRSCPWVFPSESAMLSFVKLLFGMPNVDEALLRAALNTLGIERQGSSVVLRWGLLYAVLEPETF